MSTKMKNIVFYICYFFGRNQEQFSTLCVYELQCIYTNKNMKITFRALLCFFQLNLKSKEHTQPLLQISKQFDQLQRTATVPAPGCCLPIIVIMLIICENITEQWINVLLYQVLQLHYWINMSNTFNVSQV